MHGDHGVANGSTARIADTDRQVPRAGGSGEQEAGEDDKQGSHTVEINAGV
jgi:hypothetical protein